MKKSGKVLLIFIFAICILLIVNGVFLFLIQHSISQMLIELNQSLSMSTPSVTITPGSVDLIKNTLVGIENIITFLLLLLSICFVFVLLVYILSYRDYKNLENYNNGKKSEFHIEEGSCSLISAVEVLDQDPSVLRNIMSWLYKYRKGKSDSESAFHIFSQLLIRFSDFDFKPMGEIGDTVNFDPRIYRNYDQEIKQGDRVVIIETGWKLGQKIIRKPLIEVEK